ncbi:MAG: DNA repair protein RecO [Verrucomicrobia subdivision 3 bacterium]|nr:DNA repair protein RecO [Limisphaerales bacterium]
MDENGHGIILRVRPLTETSLIVHWLTPEHGRLGTVAKGARRAKSTFRGKLDLLFEGGFAFRRSRKSDLHILREVNIQTTHADLRNDIPRLQLLAYATRFVESATEPENSLPGIHAIFSTLLNHLDTHPTRPALVYALEIKLLNELGLAPSLDEARLNDGTRDLLNHLAILNWKAITQLKPTRPQAEAARQFLGNFIQHNLGKTPKGRDTALGI